MPTSKSKVKKTSPTSSFKAWLRGNRLILLLPLLIFFGFYYKSILQPGIAGGGDLYNFYSPFVDFLISAIRKNELPLWNPYLGGGVPMTIFSPIFYPLNFLRLFLGVKPFLLSFYFIQFMTAFYGMYLLCRNFGQSRSASFIGGIIFSINGFFAVRIYQGHIDLISQAALIPWEFFLIHRYFQVRKYYFLLLLAPLFGLQILAGHLQLAYYSILITSVFFLFLLIVVIRKTGISLLNLQPLWWYGISLVCALGISSLSWLPTQLSTFFSTRALPLTYEESASFAQPLSSIPLLLFPAPFTKAQVYEGINFLGLIPFILAITAIIVFRRNRYVIFFAVLALFSLLLSASSQTPIFNILYHLLPGFSQMRAHARILIFFSVSMAILGSFGFTYFQHRWQNTSPLKKLGTKEKLLLTVALLALITPLIKAAAPSFLPGFARLNLGVYLPSFGLFIIFFLLFKKQTLSLFKFKIIFTIILAFNFYAFANDYLKPGKYDFPQPLDLQIATYIKSIHPNPFPKVWHDVNFEDDYLPRGFNLQQFGVYEMQALGRNWLSKSYLEIVRQMPITKADYEHLVYDIPYDKANLRLLGVNYILSLNIQTDPDLKLIQTFQGTKGYGMTVMNAYLYHLEGSNPMFFFQSSKEQPSVGDGTGVIGGTYNLNRVTVNLDPKVTQNKEGQYLVFNDLYFPGWTAQVNGQKTAVETVNFGAKGVKLPAQATQVEFRFQPLGWTESLWATLLSFITLIALLFGPPLKRKFADEN